MISSPAVTSEQRAAFDARGWVAAPGFFTPAEAAELGAWTDELLVRPEAPGAHWVYYEDSRSEPGLRIVQRIENFCSVHAGFDRVVRSDRMVAAAAELLGAPAVLFKEKINLKLPGSGGFEPHQDQQAGWSTYAPVFLTALVSIDASTVENGCLHLSDGPRATGMIGREWQPLSAAEMAAYRFRPIPTEPGDVLFFDSFTPHWSEPNRTDRPRRILYLTYNRAADGDQRARYHADKHAAFPPDIDRRPGTSYTFRV